MTEREGCIYLYQKSSCGSNQASEWRWYYWWPLSNARWCKGEGGRGQDLTAQQAYPNSVKHNS